MYANIFVNKTHCDPNFLVLSGKLQTDLQTQHSVSSFSRARLDVDELVNKGCCTRHFLRILTLNPKYKSTLPKFTFIDLF
jgi:hypothetical protein